MSSSPVRRNSSSLLGRCCVSRSTIPVRSCGPSGGQPSRTPSSPSRRTTGGWPSLRWMSEPPSSTTRLRSWSRSITPSSSAGDASPFRTSGDTRRSAQSRADPLARARAGGGAPPPASSWEPLGRGLLGQQRVDPLEAGLRTLGDAVAHRRVAVLGRVEAHRLHEPRAVAEVLELQRLDVVLERLEEPLRRDDLVELAVDDAVLGAEAPASPGADVHLLDDGVVPPP